MDLQLDTVQDLTESLLSFLLNLCSNDVVIVILDCAYSHLKMILNWPTMLKLLYDFRDNIHALYFGIMSCTRHLVQQKWHQIIHHFLMISCQHAQTQLLLQLLWRDLELVILRWCKVDWKVATNPIENVDYESV
jgi:hypothetical protein